MPMTREQEDVLDGWLVELRWALKEGPMSRGLYCVNGLFALVREVHGREPKNVSHGEYTTGDADPQSAAGGPAAERLKLPQKKIEAPRERVLCPTTDPNVGKDARGRRNEKEGAEEAQGMLFV